MFRVRPWFLWITYSLMFNFFSEAYIHTKGIHLRTREQWLWFVDKKINSVLYTGFLHKKRVESSCWLGTPLWWIGWVLFVKGLQGLTVQLLDLGGTFLFILIGVCIPFIQFEFLVLSDVYIFYLPIFCLFLTIFFLFVPKR